MTQQTSDANGTRMGRPAWLVIGVVIGLAGGGLMRTWPAAAQPQMLPNAADQRIAIVAEIRVTNAKLEAIHGLLASGKVVVQVKEGGSPPAAGNAARPANK